MIVSTIVDRKWLATILGASSRRESGSVQGWKRYPLLVGLRFHSTQIETLVKIQRCNFCREISGLAGL